MAAGHRALALLEGKSLFDANGEFPIEAVREHVGRRLHLAPRFRQVLYWPKRGLGWPVWEDAQYFDVAQHVGVFSRSDWGWTILRSERISSFPGSAWEARVTYESEALRGSDDSGLISRIDLVGLFHDAVGVPCPLCDGADDALEDLSVLRGLHGLGG
jgi:hypothetical protein